MEFVWTPDQRAFRSGVRRQLQSRAPVARARDLLGERHDPDLWREPAQQSGPAGGRGPGEVRRPWRHPRRARAGRAARSAGASCQRAGRRLGPRGPGDAGLATRAERQDDGTWLVNGQKVWSSFAHPADFGMLMARTDPSPSKRRGITCFLLDMRTPGVETRPLRQMTGAAEFNDVFLTDVVVPDEVRLGAVNDGWAVGISTLLQERSGLSGRPGVGTGRADELMTRAQATGAWACGAVQDQPLTLSVRERVLQRTTPRAFAEAGTVDPGPEGSIRKLADAVLLEDLACLAMDLEPFGGASWPAGTPAPQATEDFLAMKELSIASGTSEIQRNIIAERLLGLPKDVDPERGLPFERRLRS